MKKGKSYDEPYRWLLVPLEVLKESPGYEFLLKDAMEYWREVGREIGRAEVREEARKEDDVRMMSEILLEVIARRFPRMRVAQKIKRIRDAALLLQIVIEVGDMKDAATLRCRLDDAIKSQDH